MPSRQTTWAARKGASSKEKGSHGHDSAGPRPRGPPRGRRRIGVCRGLGRRSPEAECHRPDGGDLRRGHGRRAHLGDAVQRPVRHRLRDGHLHAGGVPLRDDHPHDLRDRLRRDGDQDALGGRLLLLRATNFNAWFGWEIPWVVFALFAAVLISVLCYFDVELSVRVLGAALIGEIIILAIFDLLVFGQGGGSDGIHLEALNVFQLTDPGVGLAAGVGLFLAFWSWVGFEAVPNYAEESRDPKRIVVQATLISVVALGIGYVITSLAFVSAFPEASLVEDAQNPEGPFFVAMADFGSEGMRTAMEILILTGAFACAMAFHNVAMRYGYALGREGILPKALGRTHPKYKSPHVASIVQTCIAVGLVLIWGLGAGFGFGD